MYVANSGNHKIRRISPAGMVSTIAGSEWENPRTARGFFPFPISTGSLPVALAADAAGNIYVADPGVGVLRKVAPSGVMTKFNFESGVLPRAVVTDALGNVYATPGCAIVKIATGGATSALAGASRIHPASRSIRRAIFMSPTAATTPSAK